MEQPTNLFELQLDQPSINYLNEAARWGRFLAIIGFIYIGLSYCRSELLSDLLGPVLCGAGGGR